MSALIALARWCWCQYCMIRTDQDKTPQGWQCKSCGNLLDRDGSRKIAS